MGWLDNECARVRSVTANRDTLSYLPRGMSQKEAARYIGVGTTLFDRLVAEGRMPRPLRVGKLNILDRLKLEAAFTELDEEVAENQIDRELRLVRSGR